MYKTERTRDPEIASRISHLRRVLQDLRIELYRERLNLQREHYRCSSIRDAEVTECTDRDVEPSNTSNIHMRQPWDLTVSEHVHQTRSKLLNSADDLDLGELASFYRRKINDLETDFCAGLNLIRSRYAQSLSMIDSFEKRTDATSTISLTADDENSERWVTDLTKCRSHCDFDAKSINEGVETLWAAIDDPFDEDDLSSLMNEAQCANECFDSNEFYQELILPSESNETNLAF